MNGHDAMETGEVDTVPPLPAPDGNPTARRGRWVRLAAMAAALVAVALVGSLPEARPPEGALQERDSPTWQPSPAGALEAAEDPLHRRVLAELSVFTQWLQENEVDGYIGEIGIPHDQDSARWGFVAERWFAEADRAGLWVDVWSVGEWWGEGYDYSPFVAVDGGPVETARPHGELLAWQAQHGVEPRGVNLSGAEFGAAGGTDKVTEFSNENPGEYDRDYHYDTQETFDYLAARGIDTVRLPFRWERIQPRLAEDLDSAELARLRHAVHRAERAGLEVILDVHNFGAYHLSDGEHGVRRAIGSTEVARWHFADLWRRLSQAFGDEPGVVAYDLMNEPVDLPEEFGMTPAQVWERASQDAVDAIRGTGDDTMIMVPGYQWSHVKDWARHHPQAWIEDPRDQVRYTAHHYWRLDYDRSYAQEVADARKSGF